MPWVDNDGIINAARLKALGEGGITFDQFYASPTCSPSRAAALTGYYPIHNGFNVSDKLFFPKHMYTLRHPVMGEVLSTRIWGVPPACLGSR